MNSMAELYAYILSVRSITSKIDKISGEKFINNEEMISSYYAIFKDLIEYLLKLDDMFTLHSKLNILVKEIYEADRFMMNNYKMINSSMLYDFFKVDYKRLTNIVEELVK